MKIEPEDFDIKTFNLKKVIEPSPYRVICLSHDFISLNDGDASVMPGIVCRKCSEFRHYNSNTGTYQ